MFTIYRPPPSQPCAPLHGSSDVAGLLGHIDSGDSEVFGPDKPSQAQPIEDALTVGVQSHSGDSGLKAGFIVWPRLASTALESAVVVGQM